MDRLNHWPRRRWIRSILRCEGVRSLFPQSITAVLACVVPCTSIVPWRNNDTGEVRKIRDSPEIIKAIVSKIGNWTNAKVKFRLLEWLERRRVLRCHFLRPLVGVSTKTEYVCLTKLMRANSWGTPACAKGLDPILSQRCQTDGNKGKTDRRGVRV
jgi:hypothetical protein